MNEQLVVKNFGPIKDATVDFKRVTVFIGPTGGGKSTLAKLAAIFRDIKFHSTREFSITLFDKYGVSSYFKDGHFLSWGRGNNITIVENKNALLSEELASLTDGILESQKAEIIKAFYEEIGDKLTDKLISIDNLKNKNYQKELFDKFFHETVLADAFARILVHSKPEYIPSERTVIASLEYSWAGLMRDDIGLPKSLLDFANSFSLSRKDINELEIPFFNVKYLHINGRDFIKIPEREEPLMLLETASGIQSVTPLLVLLEHLSRNTEQAQSFIIEEPELNLYPTAQRDLVYTLLEKCTQGENDLTITTHSPYVLTALNIALYANKIATQYPHQKKKVEKILPAKYWLKPEDFSAYYVGGGGVNSIFDTKAGLIDENSLDSVSMELADVFNALTRLRKPKAVRK